MDTRVNILRVVANKYAGKSIDGPNDLVMDSKGGIYFTDPQFTPDKVKNQPGRTVYYITPKGEVIRLLEPNAFAMPNGVALSPDGKILYINNCYDNETWWNVDSDKDNYVWAYDVKDDGTLANGRKFAQLYLTGEVLDRRGRTSGADGMKVDASGNVYVCTYAGIQIFNPEGKFVGIINTPTHPVNCAFGGPDMQTLYITSFNKIYSIRTNMRGTTSPM
jgi:gluconolactonase